MEKEVISTYMCVYQERKSCISMHIPKYMENSHQILWFLGRMVLEWHEREHEDVERDVQGDLMAQKYLRAWGLYKFWCLGSLRDKPRLLQMLGDYWDPDTKTFHIDKMPLILEVEDIYFITGLSCRVIQYMIS